jgi:hypothetical protein
MAPLDEFHQHLLLALQADVATRIPLVCDVQRRREWPKIPEVRRDEPPVPDERTPIIGHADDKVDARNGQPCLGLIKDEQVGMLVINVPILRAPRTEKLILLVVALLTPEIPVTLIPRIIVPGVFGRERCLTSPALGLCFHKFTLSGDCLLQRAEERKIGLKGQTKPHNTAKI